jgi:hypothetical protein
MFSQIPHLPKIPSKGHFSRRMSRNTGSDEEHERYTLEAFHFLQQSWELHFVFVEYIPFLIFLNFLVVY